MNTVNRNKMHRIFIGLLGQLAGQVMANRSSNIERNRWMLELMRLKPRDRILEIGYGPGLALEGALQQAQFSAICTEVKMFDGLAPVCIIASNH